MKAVITTINPPSEAVKKLASLTDLIVVGDRKTPEGWHHEGVEYYPIERQNDFAISKLLPENHYCRKNIGYLLAMKSGTDVIYDIDDDNCPNDNWKKRVSELREVKSITLQGWFNVYSQFHIKAMWPRGLPLNQWRENSWAFPDSQTIDTYSYVQQGLADHEPDVDAVWRMTFGALYSIIDFDKDLSLHLSPGCWCPFNSQSTWFFKQAFPLMYLPVYATFRMTDIWRGFVAQRCLWEMNSGITFHSPAEVFQDRNPHDLTKDFEQEIPGYLHNENIAKVLTDLSLEGNIYQNMVTCYQALIDMGVLPEEEMPCLKAWISDVKEIL